MRVIRNQSVPLSVPLAGTFFGRELFSSPLLRRSDRPQSLAFGVARWPLHSLDDRKWFFPRFTGRRPFRLRRQTTVRAGSIGKTEKYQKSAIEPKKIGIGEMAEVIAHILAWHRRDLVDHDLAWPRDPGCRGGLYGEPDQWRIDGVRRQRAHRNRSGRVEAIVLDDDYKPWLSGVGATCGSDVDVTSSHSPGSASASQSTEMASTNAWSSTSCSLAAMAADWR